MLHKMRANNAVAGMFFILIGFLVCASCSGSVKVEAPPSSYFLEDYEVSIPDQCVISGAAVTPEFFQSIKATPEPGRGFQPENYSSGAKNVVLISHRIWQDRFSGDARLIGRMIEINGSQFVVIGIMPAEFDFPPGVDLWIPKQSG
jgi:hypothetical protein